LYIQTKDPNYLKMGLQFADKQWGSPEGPRVRPNHTGFTQRGLTWQTRMWIDDMFMITAVQSQAYRATGDRKYIDPRGQRNGCIPRFVATPKRFVLSCSGRSVFLGPR
jgi:rhamnogalacturonyl hydrolase YesR